MKTSSTSARIAASAWSFCAPTMAKKISVDSTSKLPPSTSGLPKSAMLSMKPSRKALARPGRISGSDTVQKVCQRLARKRLRGLLHRRADAFDDADQHQEGDRREGEHLGDQQAGQAIDPARRLHAEQMPAKPWVTAPDRPNSRMMARPMTKGGVMIGSTVSARSSLP